MIEDRLLRPSMVIVSSGKGMIKTTNQSLAHIFEELY